MGIRVEGVRVFCMYFSGQEREVLVVSRIKFWICGMKNMS